MKQLHRLIICCALLALGIVCLAATTPDVEIDYAESTFLKRKYQSMLMQSHLKNTPKWESEKNPPPLTAKKAAALAIADVEIRLGRHPFWPDSPGWSLHQIALVAVYDSNVWYYRISVTPDVPGSGNHPDVTLFVTLDGKVVPLTKMK